MLAGDGLSTVDLASVSGKTAEQTSWMFFFIQMLLSLSDYIAMKSSVVTLNRGIF